MEEQIKNGSNGLTLQMNKLQNREQAQQAQFEKHPDNEQLRDQLGRTQSQIWALQNGHESSPCQ